MIEFAEYGYWGLFLASFLAATILPFSSEALLGLMLLGKSDIAACIIIASAGNWLGGMTSYLIGRLGKWVWIEKYLRVKKTSIDRLKIKLDKYGSYLAFFCWIPIVGDPIAVTLGFFKINAWKTAIYMLIGKAFRYVVIGWVIVKGITFYG